MLDIIKITIEEFKNDIYDEYIELFPEEEQREFDKIEKTYNDGIESFYKIVLDDKTIGFFTLEKLNDQPYYMDYFGIFKEYQNKGYGTEAWKLLLSNIVKDVGLIGEIEKVVDDKTKRRLEFYKNLGFKEIDSEYLLYGVNFVPIIFMDNNMSKEEVDKALFDYYLINVGQEELNKNCRVLK